MNGIQIGICINLEMRHRLCLVAAALWKIMIVYNFRVQIRDFVSFFLLDSLRDEKNSRHSFT